jgi:hypothetical protein
MFLPHYFPLASSNCGPGREEQVLFAAGDPKRKSPTARHPEMLANMTNPMISVVAEAQVR